MEKNNSALFFTCSLVEFIGRETKNKRQDILNYLGKEEVSRIFKYADVFHCEPIEKVAEDFIERNSIVQGNLTMWQLVNIQCQTIGILEKFLNV